MKEIAENIFQTVYSEYKDYQTFFAKKAETPEKRREDTARYVMENQDNAQGAIDKVFEAGVGYLFHEKDLAILRAKLYHTFKAYEDILEIPQEVKTEINSFKIEPLYYLIDNGKEVEITPDLIEAIKNQMKKDYALILEESEKVFDRGK